MHIYNNKIFASSIRRHQIAYKTLFIAILILINFSTLLSQSVQSSSARFLVLSDWGGFASNNQKAVAEAMAKEALNIEAQFVVTVGDKYHVDGINSATDSRWKTEFEDVYSHPSLQIPWYPSLGNHDYRGDVESQIEYSKLSTRWKLTSRYYTQKERIDDSSFVLIVHLYTSPFIEKYRIEFAVYHLEDQNAKKQIVWLDSVLTVSNEKGTIVVGHHSIYAAASNHGNTKELIEQVLPILTKHNVPLYICGHYHVMQHLKNGKIDFVVCGGGMEAGTVDERDDVVFGAGSLGFLSVIATVKELRVNIINEQNTTLQSILLPVEK